MTTVEVHDPRSDPEPTGWRRFLKKARLLPVWDYRLLGIEAWLARNPPVLAVAREGEETVGAFVAMVCRTVRERAYAPPPETPRRGLAPRWVEVYLPALSGHSACVFLPGVDDDRKRAAVRAFERAVVDRLGPGLLGVVYRAVDHDLGPVLSGRGRVTREIDPVAVLSDVGSAEAWERRLPDAVRDRLGAGSLRVESKVSRADLDARELATLLNDHRARQDARAWREGQRSRVGGLHLDTRSRIAPSYLDALVRRPDVVTTTYHTAEDELAAFSVLLDHEEGAALQHFAARPGSGLWVDACARAVRHTADRGRPLLTAGRTLLDRKAALGFGTRPLVSVAVPRPFLGRRGPSR